jgi:hypothetical protein
VLAAWASAEARERIAATLEALIRRRA